MDPEIIPQEADVTVDTAPEAEVEAAEVAPEVEATEEAAA